MAVVIQNINMPVICIDIPVHCKKDSVSNALCVGVGSQRAE